MNLGVSDKKKVNLCVTSAVASIDSLRVVADKSTHQTDQRSCESVQETKKQTGGSSHKGQSVGKWTVEQMQKAWDLHRQHGYSIFASAREAGVPVSTFKDRCRTLKQAEAEGKDVWKMMGHMSGGE